MVDCLGSEPSLAQSVAKATFVRRLGEAAAPRPASYTLAFALQVRKIMEDLSQGKPLKDEAQTAIFKDPVRTAL